MQQLKFPAQLWTCKPGAVAWRSCLPTIKLEHWQQIQKSSGRSSDLSKLSERSNLQRAQFWRPRCSPNLFLRKLPWEHGPTRLPGMSCVSNWHQSKSDAIFCRNIPPTHAGFSKLSKLLRRIFSRLYLGWFLLLVTTLRVSMYVLFQRHLQIHQKNQNMLFMQDSVVQTGYRVIYAGFIVWRKKVSKATLDWEPPACLGDPQTTSMSPLLLSFLNIETISDWGRSI